MSKKDARKTLIVESFEVSAWRGEDGIMRLEVRSTAGREVILGLNHPWEGGEDGLGRMTFTDNANIIEDICGPDDTGEDSRQNPGQLRRRANDPAYANWYRVMHRGEGPMAAAERIEAVRRAEGRDPETGAFSHRKKLVVLRPTSG